MARRVIGQERFHFTGEARKTELDALAELIEWDEVDALMGDISSSPVGEPGRPPLCLLKALLLGRWYARSDLKLSEALDDRVSFRRFCGFSRSKPVPERTAFVRFRNALVQLGLGEQVFEMVTAQLKDRHIQVKQGTLIDATIIASASRQDKQARWIKHRNRKAVHGYKAHVASDAATDLVEKVSVTPANVNDGKAGVDVVPEGPGDVYADSAYRGPRFRRAVTDRGGRARVVVTHVWAKNDADAKSKLKALNAPVHKVRGRIEKIFGTWKRSYGLRQMAHRGLAKAALHVQLTAIAYNLKRSLNLARAGTA